MIQRMPRLLDGAMNERERLFPVRADAHMNLTPLSTASLTLPPDAPEVSARDFIELYAPDQSLGIFRATSVRTVYGDQREISLEEAICTLEDDLTGEDTVLNGDMGQVLETLLAFQSIQRWKLGEVESEAQFTDVEAARANVLEAVLQAVATDDTVMLVRDYSSTPWVLRVIKKPEAIACGLRLNRNLNNVTATLDDSALCTRVTAVPSEGEAITLDADTLSAWGVVHRQITITEGKEPAAEAQKYLEAHKNPALSVECDALALAELTGEPWDSFALGQLCAVALPDFGAILRERVVSIYYPDLFSDPRHVRLTLSSQVADASSALASLGAATKSNSDGLGRAFKHIRETENAVYIQAEEIMLRATKAEVAEINGVLTDKINNVAVELDATNATLRLKANQEYVDQQFSATELLLDGANARIDANALRIDEANQQISAANLAIDGANARIDAEAKRIDEANGEISSAKLAIDGANAAITAEVKRASEAEGELTGKLEITTEAITAEVTRATGEEEKLAGRIKITESSITEQAGKITEQGKLISGAQEEIDGLNKSITDIAGDVSELDGSLSGVRTKLDGVEQTVTTQAGTIDAQGKLIEGAQQTIDGLNKTITDVAGSVDTLTGTLSGVQTKLDGVEKTVTTQAGTIDAQGKLIEGAQQTIDGLNKTITDVAGSVDTLTGTLSGVQTKLDGVEKTVTTQAGTIDAQGKLIEGAQQTIDGLKGEISQKVSKNGLISEINQSAEEIKISASKVNLVGYVTAEYLQAHYVEADEISSFVTGEIDLERVNADSGSIMSLYCDSLTVNSWPVDMGTHFHTFTANADGTVTIGGPSATAGSFNIADTLFYKNGVSAAKDQVTVSGSWSGGAYTAKTNAPHPRSASTFISGTATGTYNETTHQYDISAPVNYSAGPGSAGGGSTGYTITGTTGTEAYSAGVKSVYVEKQSWSNPAQGYVMCTITLSNGITRSWSEQVPSSWM